MRVAIVHDDLVQWGGAERVLSGLCELYPDAPIYTSVYDRDNLTLKRYFVNKKIYTSFLQKVPGWRSLYKTLLPFYPIAFEQFNFTGFDLVISNTTRFAKSIITKPGTTHICYCHTPPRFLWHFSGYKNFGIGELLMSKLRIYDQIAAKRVDHFIAGSENAKRRIRRVYNTDSKVVYPFIDLERFTNIQAFDGGYFLVIGRSSKYKRFDLAMDACREIGVELKIVDGTFSDDLVVQILAGCKALIIPGIEDFGLASLEAQALGKPIIAYKDGGVLETVIDKKTGIFFDEQKIESLVDAIARFNNLTNWNREIIKKNAQKFSKENFQTKFKNLVSGFLLY